MLGYEKEQRSLTREQKEAVGLLSVGTLLEYFDLMLYIHMASLLNELFFPKFDAHAAFLLTAFSFCSTYAFRPIGALIFGYLGDKIGRKSTVVITTFLMAGSCLVMSALPTYAEYGAFAAVIVTICRAVQGISSLGEIVGAELYITETNQPPIQYPMVALCEVFGNIGGVAALGVAALATSHGFNWRLAFLFGAVIAMVGAVARTRLRETPEFTDATKRLTNKLENVGIKKNDINISILNEDKLNIKTILAYLPLETTGPICFYFSSIQSGEILKNKFDYTAHQVISHNLNVGITSLVATIILSYLSYKIHPLKILKIRWTIFTTVFLFYPYWLNNLQSPSQLLLLQLFVQIFAVRIFPAAPVFYKHFPVLKRFRCATISFAVVRTVMFLLISFGLIYLIEYFTYWGLLILALPFIILYRFGLNYFEKLENERAENLLS
ncbi:hypothetical protein H6P87_01011 [Rickettsia tillamookensis]|uniref:Major facilitator superfamily (MFS) profile domain-containing protein n=1 Tax=Rickettsia tillamookensis TaxID=2761623 RepID=A0A9E6MII6_9RICK|nr:MFS transporter [Rickettsia tillamookensis]QQV75454.1 hypothetical protein H6P87_01011 [Rickettsia tillamookensis]